MFKLLYVSIFTPLKEKKNSLVREFKISLRENTFFWLIEFGLVLKM